MQDEHRSVWRNRVEFIDSRQPLLGKLLFCESSYDAHPLRWRRDRHLLFQHRHSVCKRPHAVPAQFHIEVQPAPDDVKMVVDQSRKNATSLDIDHPSRRTSKPHHVAFLTDGHKQSVFDGHGTSYRIGAIESGKAASMKDQIRRLVCHVSFSAFLSLSTELSV